ncbi:MAG: mannitol dehydrogenase family protein [Rhizobiaceae bacterium]
MSMRLSENAVGIKPADRPKPGIAHLGLGAFFRAHGVSYIRQARLHSGGDWGIIGVSLKRPIQRDLLAPQDFIYTAIERHPEKPEFRHLDDVTNILVAPEDPTAVLETMSDPAIKIVSLTVTERGYCLDPATGRLDMNHPEIRHDVENGLKPQSAIGFLVYALALRRDRGLGPFTILSCDNISQNGHTVRRAVQDFAEKIDADLARWIAQQARFPCTMVDRIVPATTQADIEECADATGFLDLSPVSHEPFSQWVIEDDFVDGERPDFASAGVQLVEDTTPFETMKLRCLNGSHSSLAYLGYLAGHKTIAETVSDELFDRFIQRLWKSEIIPTLAPITGVDYEEYCEKLRERYLNPAIRHATWQIAMDGTQKLPQRLLHSLQDNINSGRPSPLICAAIAGWMRYVSGVDDDGNIIDVRDAMADELAERVSGKSQSPEMVVDSLLGMDMVFPEQIAGSTDIRKLLVGFYSDYANMGVRKTLEKLLGSD